MPVLYVLWDIIKIKALSSGMSQISWNGKTQTVFRKKRAARFSRFVVYVIVELTILMSKITK